MSKILIIRLSSIGDIVLTTPVVRSLKEQLQDAEIHYMVKKRFLPVISSNPYICKLWSFEDNFSTLIPALRAENFDFIVDLHRNFRSLNVKLRLGRPSGTFPKLNLRKWLIVNFKWDFLPDVHIVDRYFLAVKKLGVTNDGKGLDYFIPPESEVPRPFEDYIAVVIGGKHNTKIFPAEKIAEVIRRLKKPVILLGGKEDRERGDQILELCRIKSTSTQSPVPSPQHPEPRAINGCGEYSLNQAASAVRQASAVLTNDTGLMHIAAAFRKKTVSVWGSTIPKFGMFPYLPSGDSDSYTAEVKGLSCRPCSKLGFRECPRKHFRCMMDISGEEIVNHLE